MLVNSVFWKLVVAIVIWLRHCMGPAQYGFQLCNCCLKLIPHLQSITKGYPARLITMSGTDVAMISSDDELLSAWS